MNRLLWIVFIGASLLLAACSGGGSSDNSSLGSAADSNENLPGLTEYIVHPADTDAQIDSAPPTFGDHYAYINPAVSAKGKLFLFFPGSDAKPEGYRLIIQAAANNGFHAVGLAYPNNRTVATLCSGPGNSTCPGQIHEEVLTGQDVSTQVDVSSADSIENRLVKLLLYLGQQYPDDDWQQFLGANDSIQWPSIRVAGHSQGGSTAGYIGKQRAVDRVIFFSSPYDMVNNQVADWLSARGLTDPSRYFGFSHLRDVVVPWSAITQNWPDLQMDKNVGYVSVDNHTPPYDNSQMLSTDLINSSKFPDILAYHNMTVLDLNTPTDDTGLPVYRQVWQYLCFL